MPVPNDNLGNQDGIQIKGGNQAKHNKIKINTDREEVRGTTMVELDPEKEQVFEFVEVVTTTPLKELMDSGQDTLVHLMTRVSTAALRN